MGQSDYILGLLAVGMELALAERDRQGLAGSSDPIAPFAWVRGRISRESVTITAFL